MVVEFWCSDAVTVEADDLFDAIVQRLKTKYPDEAWQFLPPSLYRSGWVAYTWGWEAVLAEWDAGELGTMQPGGCRRWPMAGFRGINRWSTERGEARQRELIGMTAEAKPPVGAEAAVDRILSATLATRAD